jgi:molecular chaperone GrpE
VIVNEDGGTSSALGTEKNDDDKKDTSTGTKREHKVKHKIKKVKVRRKKAKAKAKVKKRHEKEGDVKTVEDEKPHIEPYMEAPAFTGIDTDKLDLEEKLLVATQERLKLEDALATLSQEKSVLEEDVAFLREDLEKKAQTIKDYKEQLERLRDQFDNYKRRAEEERAKSIDFAKEKLIIELLEIIGNFERAINSTKPKDKAEDLLEGVKFIHKQLHKLLEREGVKLIEALGKPFDPRVHEAMMEVETDEHPEGTVVEELEKGYSFKNRVIKATKVKVAKPLTGEKTKKARRKPRKGR